mmetsp:Transcript_47926/g.96512  ORF Transcript_47926/g.96512 Transcript_47926/m.96512 type:complete len:403 (-) Transcript_47926:254-1462(-)
MEGFDDAKFHMQLELDQLQAKVRLLAGGTDGEQLAEVLLEREEELRAKEYELANATRQLHAVSQEVSSFESDRSEYEAMIRELDKQLRATNDIVHESSRERDTLQGSLNDLSRRLSQESQAVKTLQVEMLESEKLHDRLQRDHESEKSSLRGDVENLTKQNEDMERRGDTLAAEFRRLERSNQDILDRSRASNNELGMQLAEEKKKHLSTSEKSKIFQKEQAQVHEKAVERQRVAVKMLTQEKIELELSLQQTTEEAHKLTSAKSSIELELEKANVEFASELARIRARNTNEMEKHKDDLKRCSAKAVSLEHELSASNEISAEVAQLKVQNQELRAKVIRQDTAWKRKIESERRKSSCSATTTKRQPLVEEENFNPASSRPRTSLSPKREKTLGGGVTKAWA